MQLTTSGAPNSRARGSMLNPGGASRLGIRARRVAGTGASIGFFFGLLLVWLVFEFARPAHPMKIPLVISVVSSAGWLFRSRKQWTTQSTWCLVLLGTAAVGVPLAENTFSAYETTREIAIRFLCICLPLQSVLTSVYRVRAWILTLLIVVFYVGAWATTHGGYGPSAGGGGQDENYIAAMTGMALPFAYFSIIFEKRMSVKAGYVIAIFVYVAAIAVGTNPSRGGFLGLCAVALYCLARSPRKVLGISVLASVAVAFVLAVGPAFWAEIGTSTDYQGGTGGMRIELWKAGLRMWALNPLLGVGPDNFRWVIGYVQTPEQFELFGRSLAGSVVAHSTPVEMVAELGSIGAMATIVMVWRTWVDLGKVRDQISVLIARRVADDDLVRLRYYADAVRASIFAVIVNGVFLSLFYYSHLWLLIVLGASFPLIVRARLQRIEGVPEQSNRNQAPPRRVVVGSFAPRVATVLGPGHTS